jgi:hypothetical protein
MQSHVCVNSCPFLWTSNQKTHSHGSLNLNHLMHVGWTTRIWGSIHTYLIRIESRFWCGLKGWLSSQTDVRAQVKHRIANRLNGRFQPLYILTFASTSPMSGVSGVMTSASSTWSGWSVLTTPTTANWQGTCKGQYLWMDRASMPYQLWASGNDAGTWWPFSFLFSHLSLPVSGHLSLQCVLSLWRNMSTQGLWCCAVSYQS